MIDRSNIAIHVGTRSSACFASRRLPWPIFPINPNTSLLLLSTGRKVVKRSNGSDGQLEDF